MAKGEWCAFTRPSWCVFMRPSAQRMARKVPRRKTFWSPRRQHKCPPTEDKWATARQCRYAQKPGVGGPIRIPGIKSGHWKIKICARPVGKFLSQAQAKNKKLKNYFWRKQNVKPVPSTPDTFASQPWWPWQSTKRRIWVQSWVPDESSRAALVKWQCPVKSGKVMCCAKEENLRQANNWWCCA